jgi:hypothetical protein
VDPSRGEASRGNTIADRVRSAWFAVIRHDHINTIDAYDPVQTAPLPE